MNGYFPLAAEDGTDGAELETTATDGEGFTTTGGDSDFTDTGLLAATGRLMLVVAGRTGAFSTGETTGVTTTAGVEVACTGCAETIDFHGRLLNLHTGLACTDATKSRAALSVVEEKYILNR